MNYTPEQLAELEAQSEYWARVGNLIGKRLIGFTGYHSSTFEDIGNVPGDVADRILGMQDEIDNFDRGDIQ